MSLSRAPSDATREHVAALVLQVAARERDLAALKTELHTLQARYLDEIGPLYAELIPLDAAVAEAEIKAGLRLPDDEMADDAAEPESALRPGCGSVAAPSGDLKRMFRDIAKAVHPDRSNDPDLDERTRYRRHSLMAEANRAYADRDEDRLRLILRSWELDPDSVTAGDPDEDQARVSRRASALHARLADIDREFADLRRSAIARLNTRIDDARAQGWDLFAEMIRQVQREIALGKAKLKRLT